MDGSNERDRAVERALRRALPRSGDASSACLDAETMAAWIDGGLSGPALDIAQSHVADCARCQAMVGALARVDSRAPSVVPERAVRPGLAWLVPLAAAAATVAIWVAVPRNSAAPPVSPPIQEPATPATSRDAVSKNELDQAKPPAADEKKQIDSAAEVRMSDAQSRQQPSREVSELSKGKARPVEERAPSSNAQRAAAASAPSAAGAVRPPVQVDKIEMQSRVDAPSMRWRIASSRVQRSANGGVGWEDVSTGVTTPLTALAAPSASVCWVVGREGVVLLSIDGSTWRRLQFPETADLSAIQATDARRASVSTADGRTFDTTDGGLTWVVRRPLQEF